MVNKKAIFNIANESNLSNMEVIAGSMTYTADTNNIYFDIDTENDTVERIKITDIIIINDDSSKLKDSKTTPVKNPIEKKLYVFTKSEDALIYYINKKNIGKWIFVSSYNNRIYTIKDTFKDEKGNDKDIFIENASVGSLIIDDNEDIGVITSKNIETNKVTIRVLIEKSLQDSFVSKDTFLTVDDLINNIQKYKTGDILKYVGETKEVLSIVYSRDKQVREDNLPVITGLEPIKLITETIINKDGVGIEYYRLSFALKNASYFVKPLDTIQVNIPNKTEPYNLIVDNVKKEQYTINNKNVDVIETLIKVSDASEINDSFENYKCEYICKLELYQNDRIIKLENGWDKLSSSDSSGSRYMTPISGDIILVGWKNADRNELPLMYDDSNPSITNGARVLYAKNYTTDCHAIRDAYNKISKGGTIKLVGYFMITKHEDFRWYIRTQHYHVCVIEKSLTVDAYDANFIIDQNTIKTENEPSTYVSLFIMSKQNKDNNEYNFELKGLTANLSNLDIDTNETYYNLFYYRDEGSILQLNVSIIDCNITMFNTWLAGGWGSYYEGSSITVKNCTLTSNNTALPIEAETICVVDNKIKGSTGIALDDTVQKGIISGNDIYYDKTGINISLYGFSGLNIVGNNIRCTGKNLNTYDPSASSNYGFYTTGIKFEVPHSYNYDHYLDYVMYGTVISDNKIETYDLGIDYDMRLRANNCIITNNIITHCRPTDKALPEYSDVEKIEKLRETLTYGIWCAKAVNCIIKDNICTIKKDLVNFPNGYPTYLQLEEKTDTNIGDFNKNIILDVDTLPTNISDLVLVNAINKHCYHNGIYNLQFNQKNTLTDTSSGVDTEINTRNIVVIVQDNNSNGKYKDSEQYTLYNDELVGHGSIIQQKIVTQYVFFENNAVYNRQATYEPTYSLMDLNSSRFKKIVSEITWKLTNSSNFVRFITGDNLTASSVEALKSENYPFKVLEGGTLTDPLTLYSDSYTDTSTLYNNETWPDEGEIIYAKNVYLKLSTDNEVQHLKSAFLFLFIADPMREGISLLVNKPHVTVMTGNDRDSITYYFSESSFISGYDSAALINAYQLRGRDIKDFAQSEQQMIHEFSNVPLKVGIYSVAANSTDAPITSNSLWYVTVYRMQEESAPATFRMIAYCTDLNKLYTQTSDDIAWLNDWTALAAGSNASSLNGKTDTDFVNIIKTTTSTNIDSLTTDGFYDLIDITSATKLPTFENAYSGRSLIVKSVKGDSPYNCCYQFLAADGLFDFYVRAYHGKTWSNWRKIWNQGNQGDGSGLDADKLDGKQGTEFVYNGTTSYTSISSLPNHTGIYYVKTSEITGISASFAITKFYYTSSAYTLQASNCTDGTMYFGSRSGSTITWKKVGAGVEVVTADPRNAVTGDIWIRSDLS